MGMGLGATYDAETPGVRNANGTHDSRSIVYSVSMISSSELPNTLLLEQLRDL